MEASTGVEILSITNNTGLRFLLEVMYAIKDGTFPVKQEKLEIDNKIYFVTKQTEDPVIKITVKNTEGKPISEKEFSPYTGALSLVLEIDSYKSLVWK